jgi:hypothetical protein
MPEHRIAHLAPSLFFQKCSQLSKTQQDANVLAANKYLWRRNDVPSKVNVFGWRLLLNRLPIRSALNRRGILFNSHDLPGLVSFVS